MNENSLQMNRKCAFNGGVQYAIVIISNRDADPGCFLFFCVTDGKATSGVAFEKKPASFRGQCADFDCKIR